MTIVPVHRGLSPVFADAYALDFNGKLNLPAMIAAGEPWAGVGLKVSEGTYYPDHARSEWIKHYWPIARSAAGVRYGLSWFRYGYHYFRVDEDPRTQAELFLRIVDQAGGWGPGDMRPMVDVETSENPHDVTAQQIIDQVTEYAEHIERHHGRKPTLYAGSYFRDHGVRGLCGCANLSVAAYATTLPSHLYTDMGIGRTDLLSWQYQGTEGYTGPVGYPRLCPVGSGPADLSVVTMMDTMTPAEQLAWIRAHELGAT